MTDRGDTLMMLLSVLFALVLVQTGRPQHFWTQLDRVASSWPGAEVVHEMEAGRAVIASERPSSTKRSHTHPV